MSLGESLSGTEGESLYMSFFEALNEAQHGARNDS
jgi:hypothetical protein